MSSDMIKKPCFKSVDFMSTVITVAMTTMDMVNLNHVREQRLQRRIIIDIS